MPFKSLYTEGGRCQCVYSEDPFVCGSQDGAIDLWTDGLLDHSRVVSDELISTCCEPCDQVNFDFGNGYNWRVPAWPYVFDKNGPPVFVVLPPRKYLRFCVSKGPGDCLGEGSYVYSPGGCSDCSESVPGDNLSGDQLRYTLLYDDGNDEFVLEEAERSTWRFLGFKPGTIPKGRFKSYESGCQKAEVTGYTGYGHITGIEFTANGNMIGRLAYSYQVFGDGAERAVSATYFGSAAEGGEQSIRRVLYTYYGDGGGSGSSSSSSSGAEEYGSLGDLKTATHQQYIDGQWVTTGTYYYRYYLADNNAHRLKYLVDPEAYENLAADPEVSDPLTASDAKVAQYAANYYEYDDSGRVSKEVTRGSQESTFTYQDGDQSDTDYNNFKLKKTETRADGHVRTVYTNFAGQVLLEEAKESASAQESSIEYREYDSDGNLTLHATPSALDGYSVDGYSITPQYRSEDGQYNVGLVHVYDYYDQTTTNNGGVAVKGFKEYDKVKQGRDGTEIRLRKYEYTQVSYTLDLGGSSSSSTPSTTSTVEPSVPPPGPSIRTPTARPGPPRVMPCRSVPPVRQALPLARDLIASMSIPWSTRSRSSSRTSPDTPSSRSRRPGRRPPASSRPRIASRSRPTSAGRPASTTPKASSYPPGSIILSLLAARVKAAPTTTRPPTATTLPAART